MNKGLSLVVSALLCGNLYGLDINLKKGWNAVGISSEGTFQISDSIDTKEIDLVVTYDEVGYPIFYYPGKKPKYNGFDSFKEGKGYWVKATEDTEITIGDTPISLSKISFSAGWNMVAIPEMDIEKLVDFFIRKRDESEFNCSI
jgi:hypothetical protein